MKELPLTQGHIALVDDEDFERVSKYKWSAAVRWEGRHVVAQRNASEDCHHEYLHRFILDAPKGVIVDHINGDPLDNRKSNLRLCTQGENTRNQRKSRTSSTGYKGVSRRSGGKWRARIMVEGQLHSLGNFSDPENAARAYDEAAMKLHGEFARLNFPKDVKCS